MNIHSFPAFFYPPKLHLYLIIQKYHTWYQYSITVGRKELTKRDKKSRYIHSYLKERTRYKINITGQKDIDYRTPRILKTKVRKSAIVGLDRQQRFGHRLRKLNLR